MKLYVNEKLLSLHRKFFVLNEAGENVYEISSKAFSIGDKTTILDMSGNKIAYIAQDIWHLTSHYKVFINEQEVCQIIKKFQLARNDYELTNGYRVEGNIFAYDFVIYDDTNTPIGSIKRALISFGDKYEIEIFDETKLNIVLAIIVAITNDINRSQNAESSSD